MALLDKFWFGCGHCHGQDNCPLAEAAERTSGEGLEPYRGKGLAASAGVVFLLPLLFVMVGAYLAGEFWAQDSFASLGRWQTGGAVAGFLAGVVLAKFLLVLMSGRRFVDNGSVKND